MKCDSPKQSDEEAIVKRFREGDPAAIEDLMTVYGIQLNAFLINNRPTAVQADDIAQEMWIRVWKARLQYIDGNFRGWLFTIARRVLAEVHRKRRPELLPETYDPAAAENDWEDPRLEALKDCLEQLAGDFLVTIRGLIDGLTTRELSEQLGVPEGTISSRSNRGKKLLKKCVEQKMQRVYLSQNYRTKFANCLLGWKTKSLARSFAFL